MFVDALPKGHLGSWYLGPCIFVASFLISFASPAQKSNQFWAEYQLDVPFANKYLFEPVVSYQTLWTGTPNDKWWTLALSNTFEYSILRTLDLTVEVPLGWTKQKEGSNTFEISPLAGARFHITQGKRVDFRVHVRQQHRFFQDMESGDWTKSNRTRLRGEAWISINKPNLFNDKLWYSFVDYEEFIVIDQQVEERFSYLRRFRLGIGYRLSYAHRFDLSYTWQQSRNEIGGAFVSTDGVIHFKYKMYLNPSGIATAPK